MKEEKEITETETETERVEDIKSATGVGEIKNVKKILVVEDEKPMARALELKLTHEGYLVKVEHDGETALLTLGQEKYDLIICDLMMPKLDGFQMLAEIKNKFSAIPIIVVSNLSQKEDKDKILSLGVKDFYIKSNVSLADIVLNVKKLLA